MMGESTITLRVTPSDRRAVSRLLDAFGGRGAPCGVRGVRRDSRAALLIDCDLAQTSLALVIALVDSELTEHGGRMIESLTPLCDDVLVAYAATLLREPELERSRLVEPHVDASIARRS